MSDYATRYGKWAVIAGASEGLGAAFAAQLAERGMRLLLLARREEVLAELAQQLRQQHGVEVRHMALDLADPELSGKLAPAVADIEVGVLVYNAAVSQMGRFVTMEEDALERMIRVNVSGPLTFLHALLPAMHERGRGAVVLMSSLAGMQGSPGIAAYAATKAFNTILGESLWHELRAQGIDVVVSCAGAIRTPGYLRTYGKEAPGILAPEAVASQTLAALGKGPRVVPGLLNRIVAQVSGRLLPRAAAIRLMAGTSDMP